MVPAADRDLREIWGYYDRVASRDAADRMFRKLIAASEDAAKRPLLRSARDKLMPGPRAVLVHPYALFYRIEDDEVEVVRVLHQRRDFEAVFQPKGSENEV